MVPHDIYRQLVPRWFYIPKTRRTVVVPPHRSPQLVTQHQTAYSSRSPPHQRLLRIARPNHRLPAYSSQPLIVRCNENCDSDSQRGRARSWSERRLAGRTWRSRCGSLFRQSFRRRKSQGGWRLRAFRRLGGRHGRLRSREKVVRGFWVKGDIWRTPIAVEPSLIASREYSTWKRRPSGEKVLLRLSGLVI